MQDRQNSANSVETNCLLISNQQAISYLSGFVQIPMVKKKDLVQLFSRKVRNKVIVHYILPCSVRRNTGFIIGNRKPKSSLGIGSGAKTFLPKLKLSFIFSSLIFSLFFQKHYALIWHYSNTCFTHLQGVLA